MTQSAGGLPLWHGASSPSARYPATMNRYSGSYSKCAAAEWIVETCPLCTLEDPVASLWCFQSEYRLNVTAYCDHGLEAPCHVKLMPPKLSWTPLRRERAGMRALEMQNGKTFN